MNLQFIEKTRNELKQEKRENKKKLGLFDKKRKLLKESSFEHKAGVTVTFAIFGYLAIYLIASFFINELGVVAFTNIFPGFSFPLVAIGGSLGVGCLIRTLVYEKLHINSKLKSFSTAKTQAEKLEEEVQYEIEMEKLKSRDLVIKQTLNILNANESVTKYVSSDENTNDKGVSKDETETRRVIEKLSKLINEQNNKLDMLSTQKTLHDRFWRFRSKTQKKLDMVINAGMCGLFAMYFSLLPLAMIKSVEFSSLSSSLTTMLIPFMAGAVGTFGYILKRNMVYKKVFNKFNSSLRENALPKSYSNNKKANEKSEDLQALIERQIANISSSLIQLEENQQVLDDMISSDQDESLSKSEDIAKAYESYLEQECSRSQTTAEPMEKASVESENFGSYTAVSYTDEDVKDYIEECLKVSSVARKENGPSLKNK